MELLGGRFFSVAGAGESHGPAITTIVNGCPAGQPLSRAEVQHYLDRRRPGSNKHGTPRQESDQVYFLSGIYDTDHDRLLSGPEMVLRQGDKQLSSATYDSGATTGEPIAAIVPSAAKRSADYAQFSGPQGEVRPGHTDLVKHHKSRGFTDVRGGGRSSFRSTVSDVIGGSIARLFLQRHFGTQIFSSICQVGPLQAQRSLAGHLEALQRPAGEHVDAEELAALEEQLEAAEIHSVDANFASRAGEHIKKTRQQGDSVGAAVEIVAVNVPPLVGEPLYNSLKMRLMGTLGGLNAVQACEIGAGFSVVDRQGSANNDPIRAQGYQSNSHGGLLGGITTGMPIVCRVSLKPTSTHALPQQSVRKNLAEIDFQLKKGRHDPCLGVRAGVTLESRLAIELMDAVLAHQAGRVDPDHFKLF
jgi:chorismate synthase